MGADKREFRISVRDLVEWVLRTGDLGSDSDFTSPARLIEATKAHQNIQKSRPAGYQAEVVVKYQVDLGDSVLVINGRIDGLLQLENAVLVEEIKTVTSVWNLEPDPLHWAQAKVYAAIFLQENSATEVQICLTYFNLTDGAETPFRQKWLREDLVCFLNHLVQEYAQWIKETLAWQQVRNHSIQELKFPYPSYRAGQRKMAVSVYKALANRKPLLACAPTGIGKTISVLFPAIKAIAEGIVSKVFFLTAKNSGAVAAEKAISELKSARAHLRTVFITAKEKICFCKEITCDASQCQYAIGYFDRIKPAIKESLNQELLTRDVIEQLARQFSICPFEFSLDLSNEADIIVGDYNYAFDPQASLKRFFIEGGEFALLIDEAHQLVDRAREMYSAILLKSEIVRVYQMIREAIPKCAKALNRINRELIKIRKACSDPLPTSLSSVPPESLMECMRRFLHEAENWLILHQAATFRFDLIQLYFHISYFLKVLRNLDSNYRIILFDENKPMHTLNSKIVANRGRESVGIHLFCLDPSCAIQKVVESVRGCVFFSATLVPADYFRQSLLVDAAATELTLMSPFLANNLKVMIHGGISTRYHDRKFSCQTIAELIRIVVHSKVGNYMVFFPSYEYLSQVIEVFRGMDSEVTVLEQKPGMNEEERQEYLGRFREENNCTIVGFAVLGGIFGESIDLEGDRLIGAIIVGVGLPQICLERDLIRGYFDLKNGLGFEYAYQNPGLNRVLQAVGRVIRSENDRGVVLLIDNRFRENRYRRLFPSWWETEYVSNPVEIQKKTQLFWGQNRIIKPEVFDGTVIK